MSAEAEIKQFIDRILRSPRLEAASPESLMRKITGREERLHYAIEPLIGIRRSSTIAASKARREAGNLLGWRSDMVSDRVGTWKRRSGLANVDAYLSKEPPLPLWHVSEVRPEHFGFVYLMSAVEYPGIVKVGFSADPERRLIELQRAHQIKLRLEAYVVGTKLDEHLLQDTMAAHVLANEWFDLVGCWRGNNPLIVFFTPDRMWQTILGTWREAA